MGFRRAAFMFLGCLGLVHHQNRKPALAPIKDAELLSSTSSSSSSSSSSSLSSPSDDGSFRVQLNDGRCLAYIERGVPKNESISKVIIVHGFGSSKEMSFVASRDLMDDLGVHLVIFDRAGYGESDPNPKRSVETEAMDIQELADKLQLGSKFYVIGVSLGAYPTWGCLELFPHRLAGVALVVPMINYNWPSLPADLIKDDYRRNSSRWAVRVARHAPGLLHWWVTQKIFPSSSSIIDKNPKFFNNKDLEFLKKNPGFQFVSQDKLREKCVFDSLRRDFIVAFSRWDFDPLTLENPYPKNESLVHIWQGYEDKVVPMQLQRYVSRKLPWIKYHEVPDGGHLLVYDNVVCEAILRSLLLGEDLPMYRPKSFS